VNPDVGLKLEKKRGAKPNGIPGDLESSRGPSLLMKMPRKVAYRASLVTSLLTIIRITYLWIFKVLGMLKSISLITKSTAVPAPL